MPDFVRESTGLREFSLRIKYEFGVPRTKSLKFLETKLSKRLFTALRRLEKQLPKDLSIIKDRFGFSSKE